MTDNDWKPDEPEQRPIQVDIYGVKFKTTPTETDAPPETWREVWDRIHGSLKRLASEPFTLLADSLSAARSIVKGIATIPAALSSRIAGAQDIVEKQEANPDLTLLPSAEESVAELVEIFESLRQRGLNPELRELPGGRLGIIVTADKDSKIAHGIAVETALALPEPPTTSSDESDESESQSQSKEAQP